MSTRAGQLRDSRIRVLYGVVRGDLTAEQEKVVMGDATAEAHREIQGRDDLEDKSQTVIDIEFSRARTRIFERFIVARYGSLVEARARNHATASPHVSMEKLAAALTKSGVAPSD